MRDLFRLDDKVAAVIGAGSGIGEAVAEACGRQGALVACLDVDPARAAPVAARIEEVGGRSESGALDIRDAAGVDGVLGALADRHRGLDIVVCTPSINLRKPIVSYSDEDVDRILDLNLKGSFHVLRAAGRLMTAQGRGSIVLFSSIRALVVVIPRAG